MKGRSTRRRRTIESHDHTALAVMAMTLVKRECTGRLPNELRHAVEPIAPPQLVTPLAREIARCLSRPIQEWPKLRVSAIAKDAAQRLLTSSRRRYQRYARS